MNDGAIDAERLERWALDYLGRYASSAENLRQVLRRRARRQAPESVTAAALVIDALVARYRQSGLLDDAAYAAGRAQSLHRRGGSLKSIAARLKAKGVDAAAVSAALNALAEDAAADPDLAAACAFARRRRLGPFRRGPADRERELGAFARAGFSRRVAEAVLRCRDEDAVAALSRG